MSNNPKITPVKLQKNDAKSFANAAGLLNAAYQTICGFDTEIQEIQMAQINYKGWRSTLIGKKLDDVSHNKSGKTCAFRVKARLTLNNNQKLSEWFLFKEYPTAKLCMEHGFSCFAFALATEPDLLRKIIVSMHQTDFRNAGWVPLSQIKSLNARKR